MYIKKENLDFSVKHTRFIPLLSDKEKVSYLKNRNILTNAFVFFLLINSVKHSVTKWQIINLTDNFFLNGVKSIQAGEAGN